MNPIVPQNTPSPVETMNNQRSIKQTIDSEENAVRDYNIEFLSKSTEKHDNIDVSNSNISGKGTNLNIYV